jgi:hypothetical protein
MAADKFSWGTSESLEMGGMGLMDSALDPLIGYGAMDAAASYLSDLQSGFGSQLSMPAELIECHN